MRPLYYYVIPAILVFALATYGVYQLYRSKVNEQSPTPTPTPSPFSSPARFPTSETPSQASPVLGTTSAPPDDQPATGPSLTYYLIIAGAIPTGLYLARYKKRI